MARLITSVVVLALLVVSSHADLYMQYPRGSNNRLNEQSANRDNDNRLFDSQNNGRGGVNVGEKGVTAFQGTNPTASTQGNGPTGDTVGLAQNPNDHTDMQYQMVYFEGSNLTIEWTNQHACGGNDVDDPQILNCNMVIQYTCDSSLTTPLDPALAVALWDGGNTNTATAPASITDVPTSNYLTGHHESEAWYWECTQRDRNWWLFHADQGMGGNDATHTRQNNNGNQHGLECVEERDYYPYWTPTPWIDIAYLTSQPTTTLTARQTTLCDFVTTNSQNVAPKFRCTGNDAALVQITQTGCLGVKGGVWEQTPAWGIPAPICQQGPWSRVNHLGNGRDGQFLSYNWTVPSIATLTTLKRRFYTDDNGVQLAKCTVRLRYNLSTDDYDPWAIDNSADDNQNNGVVSPVQQNPTIDIGGSELVGLKLAINTAQFGRTFQDRSHVFYIKSTTQSSGTPFPWAGKNIINLGVRGKRGNIVQTYPSVEYDWVPNRFTINSGDYIHIQWTGSNTHENQGNGGDGQTGDAGQGTDGTDRHNFVQTSDEGSNYPIPLDVYPGPILLKNSNCYSPLTGASLAFLDCAVILASSGYYQSAAAANAAGPAGGTTGTTLDALLNNAPSALVGGIIIQPNVAGIYTYTCSRNNNFSNRSQKGVIIVN